MAEGLRKRMEANANKLNSVLFFRKIHYGSNAKVFLHA
jgi:hypothetical protein